jgi:hypothetical protein
MKSIKIKGILSILLILSILMLNAVPAKASTNEILTYTDYVKTPSKAIEIGATLVVQQSYGGYIIDINNASVASYDSVIELRTISLSSPTIWANGAYATITVYYILNGSQVQETCIFYP